MPVRAAFIQGLQYDPLYRTLATFQAETGIVIQIGFQGDHPALNEHLALLDAQGSVPYDIVSTHTKYAPSQLGFLAPLDDLITAAELSDFVPLLLDLVRINGQLYALPRNIDVRLLHFRTDLLHEAPTTWDELLTTARALNNPPARYGFVFPGMESGLFGTFFELIEMAGGVLFPADLKPHLRNESGRWALGLLKTLYTEGLVPPDIPHWHFDKVHECFRSGQAAMVGDWPGFYGLYTDPSVSAVADRFGLAAYPQGPSGRSLAYGGGHSFALTKRGQHNPEALALLKFLTAPAQQLLEARNGAVPVRQSVMQSVMTTVRAEPSPREGLRWEILQDVINHRILIPPKFARYPLVEDMLWRTVQDAMMGRLEIDAALEHIEREIPRISQGADQAP